MQMRAVVFVAVYLNVLLLFLPSLDISNSMFASSFFRLL
jgi:hypothetical protein